MPSFDTFDADLAAAREQRDTDPQAWDAAKTEHAEWRRAMRLLGGRDLGPASNWPPDVLAFIDANPDDPRVAALDPDAVAARRAQLEG